MISEKKIHEIFTECYKNIGAAKNSPIGICGYDFMLVLKAKLIEQGHPEEKVGQCFYLDDAGFINFNLSPLTI